MPDWKRLVRERIGPLGLIGPAEQNLAEELGQHLEDKYLELRRAGASDTAAYRETIPSSTTFGRLRHKSLGVITCLKMRLP